MIKVPLDINLQTPLAAGSAASSKRRPDPKQAASFQSALDSPVKRSNLAGVHLQGTRDCNDNPNMKPRVSMAGKKDDDPRLATAGEPGAQMALAIPLPELPAGAANSAPALASVCTTPIAPSNPLHGGVETGKTMGLTQDKTDLESAGRHRDPAEPDASVKPRPAAASRIAASPMMVNMAESSSANSADWVPAAVKRDSADGLTTFQLQQALSHTLPLDLKVPAHVPGLQGFDAGASQARKDSVHLSSAPASSTAELYEIWVKGAQFSGQSQTLRVEIEIPELGKISARIGSGTDAVAVSLTSRDEDASLAVTELQHDMNLWLERANLETQKSDPPPDAGSGALAGSEKRRSNQDGADEGATGQTAVSGSAAVEDDNRAALSSSNRAGEIGTKWRLI